VPVVETRLLFDVPNGRLDFSAAALDAWAEHLVWCYELMGITQGATIAVQDFGSSPLSFLGSALLMPGLGRGVAERLGGRFICLDASAERISLTAAMLQQVKVDALVVRADVAALLSAEIGKKARTRSQLSRLRTIVAFGDEDPPPSRSGSTPWRYFLHVPASLLMAPECRACRCFHLRTGVYRLDGGEVSNLLYPGARRWHLPGGWSLAPGRCELAMEDSRLSPAGWKQGS
jgi:hypothetical protein